MTDQPKAAHTPGPWSEEWVRPDPKRGHTFEPRCYITGIDPEFGKVRLADIPDPTDATAEANARLIAAAPRLLEAAQESAAGLNEIAEEFGYHNVIMDAISRLQTAIALATEVQR